MVNQRKKYSRTRIAVFCIIAYLIILTIDFTLSKINQRPIAAVCTTIYKDGATSVYYGLGIK